MNIYRVWFQKERKNYQQIFGNRATAIGYACAISENKDINFVSVREFGCNEDEGIFEEGNIMYEYGDFDGEATEWGYVL